MDQVLRPKRLLQEQIEKLVEPQLRFKNQMDQVLRQQRLLHEQLDKLLRPQWKFQDQMNKLLEPQHRFQEQLDKYLEPHLKLQGQLKKYLEPQIYLHQQMSKYLDPNHWLQDQFVKYIEPQHQLQAQMEKYLEPHRRLQEQFSKYLQPLNNYLSDPRLDSVFINSDGSFSVSGETVNVESVKKSIQDISAEYENTIDFLDHLFKWLEKLSAPARFVIINLVLPYFLSIVANLTTPIYDEWWREFTDIDKRVAKKEIVREASEIYSPEDLESYRFVYTAILYVRNSGNTKAEIVDELYLGKTVRIIKKSKRWSLIEYKDADSTDNKQGWVFSRYLQRFNG